MKVLVACVRGTPNPPRDSWGHCICDRCRAYNNTRRRNQAGRTEYVKEWRKANPDRTRNYSAKWVAAHPEKRQAVVQSWRDRNPDKVAAMSSRAGCKWASTNRGKRNASVKARQHAKRRAMPAWADRRAIAAFYIEAQRLTDATGIPHEVDHIYPIQGETACGLHVPANLRVIPRRDNRSKRNRMPEGVLSFAS